MGLRWDLYDFELEQGGDNSGDYLRDIYKKLPTLGPRETFGRIQIVSPFLIFNSKQIYNEESILFSTHSVNSDASITYQFSKSASEITSGTGSNGRALRQTKRYLNYDPGHGQSVLVTFNLHEGVSDVNKMVGYFDDQDGLFLKLSGTTPYIVRRSTVSGVFSEEAVIQSDWNSDALNGSGASGYNLDFTKCQLLNISFAYLGVGSAKFGFMISGSFVKAHEFDNSNNRELTYLATPNLPVRWEMENVAPILTASLMDALCCSIISEGESKHGINRGIASDPGGVSVGGVGISKAIMSFRLKDRAKRATIFPTKINVVSNTIEPFRWFLTINPTFGSGSAPNWIDIPNSYLEVDYTQDGTILTASEGIIIANGLGVQDAVSEDKFDTYLTIASDYTGSQDVLVLAVQSYGAAAKSYHATFDWDEDS